MRRSKQRIWSRLLLVALVALVSVGGGVMVSQVYRALAAPLVSPPSVSRLTPFNSEGISPDAQPTAANFDNGGASYSNDALTAAGFAPGQMVAVGGYTFQWVTPASGEADNWESAEQTIPLRAQTQTVAFLGSAVVGPATGTGVLRFTDGSAQSYTLTFSDWTLNGGSSSPVTGNTVAVKMPYRNTASGKQMVNTYVFETVVNLPSGKTVADVTLPRTVNQGALHVFAVSEGPALSGTTLKAISNDGTVGQANFDGGNRGYSANALDAAGLAAGTQVNVYGFQVDWPTVATGINDDWNAYGAEVPLGGSGSTLEILGAAANGASSGTAAITYTDGTTQTFTLAFSDWTLGGGSTQRLPTTYVVAALPYRNTVQGKQQVTTYVFATMVGLLPGKTPAALHLPTTETGGHLNVFAAAVGTANIPPNVSAISSDASPTANFDGGGMSYSNNALAAAGFTSGSAIASHKFQFQWPTDAAGTPDAFQAQGQVLPVVSSGSTLAFLGAAANGNASGNATITYTDGTTQTFTLAFNDWTLGGGGLPLLSGETIAATTPYRNSASGPEQVKTYVFFTSVALAAGKTTQSVTLPGTVTGGSLDVFAVSGVSANDTSASNAWPTYLQNPGHSSYNASETTLTPSNVGQLHLKWTGHGQQGISDQPIVSNGMTYWGSWDGLMHATNASGTDVWTANLGQQTVSTCQPATAGVASTATLGQLGNTPALFVAGGNHTVYALNAATGAVLWSTTLTTSTEYFIWDSPVVYNGSLFLGISSFGDCPNAIGKIFKLNLRTGAIQKVLPLTTESCPGDGVWGSPTVDVATGVLYFAVGNGCDSDPNAYAVEGVSTGDLSLVDRWRVPPAQVDGDSDFGNTPTLFSAAVNGGTRQMVGVANKNGNYYAFDRTKIGAGPTWTVSLARGGDCPDCGDGSISPSAFDGTTLYVAAGNTTINNVSCTSSVSALDPATGAFKWRHCITTGPTLGAVMATPGLVTVSSQKEVYVLDATTGNVLFSYTDTSPATYFFSAPNIAGGMLYAANDDGNLYAFGL